MTHKKHENSCETVREALFGRDSVPLSMHSCRKNHGNQAAPLPSVSVHRRTFLRRERAHRLFEEPRTRVSGHRGRTGAALDLGATLAGSSGQNISASGLSEHPLTALGPGALGKAVHVHFPEVFFHFGTICFVKEKKED